MGPFNSNNFNDICVITLGRTYKTMLGTNFPVAINSHANMNALYDTEATRSWMNYDTFFNLGLYLDDKAVPRIRTVSGTDMGAIDFTTLTFAISKPLNVGRHFLCRPIQGRY